MEKKIRNRAVKPNKPPKDIKGKQLRYNPKKPGKGYSAGTAKTKIATPKDKMKELKTMRSKEAKKAEYMRIRRNYSSYKSRLKRLGVIAPELPDLVKDPKMADIKRMQEFYKLVRDTYKNGNAREYKAVIDKIYDLIYEGMMAGEFEKYKAMRLMLIIEDEGNKAYSTNDYTVIKRWKRKLPDIERVVEKFIFDSNQSDTQKYGKSNACWLSLVACIMGEESEAYSFYLNDKEENYDDVWGTLPEGWTY